MLMSVIEEAHAIECHPELAGKRILITGLTSSVGVDLVRAFAEHKARLVLQFAEQNESMDAVAEIAAQSALEIHSYGPVDGGLEETVNFARAAVQSFGGLDAVINLVPLLAPTLDAASDVDDIEKLVASRLTLPMLMSKVAANRMAMLMTEGVILNVATIQTSGTSGTKWAFATIMKSALTAMTRSQAEEWSAKGIRFNAIAPQTSALGADALIGEANVARVALYLASGNGKMLSGHVFEADCARAA